MQRKKVSKINTNYRKLDFLRYKDSEGNPFFDYMEVVLDASTYEMGSSIDEL